MDGRSLLSYFDAGDDYHPIAVMTPRGLRVIEISNDDTGQVGWRFASSDPERYELFTSGSSVVLLQPTERFLASDPPYLIMPELVLQPDEGEHFYGIYVRVVNAPGSLLDFDAVIPFDAIIWEQ